MALAAQTFADIVQALQQALGEQREALLLTMYLVELGGQVDHVVAQDALHPVVEAVLQPDDGKALHTLGQRQRQGAGADQPALVLQHELALAPGTALEQVDGQAVLEVDLPGLGGGPLAEAGAAVVGVAFQVDAVVQRRDHLGLAGAGHASDDDEVTLGDGLVQGVDEEGPQRLVTADHPGILNARLLLQPLLHYLRAQPAAEAVQVTLRIGSGEGGPGLETLRLGRTGHQLVAQLDRRLLALVLVTGAHLLPLDVRHQGQADRIGKGAPGKLHRRAHVHHRHIIKKQLAVVTGIRAHQRTSTAWVRRSTS